MIQLPIIVILLTFLKLPDGKGSIAYRHTLVRPKQEQHVDSNTHPTVVFLPGYRSVMTGTKSSALADHCRRHGRNFLCFDYRGHGASSSPSCGGKDFLDCTLTDWVEDAVAMVDMLTAETTKTAAAPPRTTESLANTKKKDKKNSPPQRKLILVGSSMGVWIAMHVSLLRPGTVSGIVGIAPAVDFTKDLMISGLSEKERHKLDQTGVLWRLSAYKDGPYPFTKKLFEDANKWLLLNNKKENKGIFASMKNPPAVHLIHGQCDKDVPWTKSIEIAENIEHDNVVVTLVKNGDHRLSTKADLQRMLDAVESLCLNKR